MRVLVLGANGFVGRSLVTALADSGWATPIAGVHREARFADGVQVVVVDATVESAIAEAIETSGADAVVNSVVGGDREGMVKNAEALFAAVAKRRLPVVHMSSMAVYGTLTGLVNEDTPIAADGRWHSQGKVDAEALASKAGTPIAILRPGCIYGGGSPQWSARFDVLLRARRIGDLGAAGDGIANLVHIDDTVRATLAALQNMPRGVRAYNLVMPNPPAWNDYFLAVAKSIGAVPLRRIPGAQLKLEVMLGGPVLKIGSKFVKTLPPAITPSLARLWRRDVTLDSTRATEELGVRWTPLADGLAGNAGVQAR
jgi:nucleoside-diphosphate-sugar epimerase